MAAYRAGRIVVTFHPKAAGRFLAARTLLPLFVLSLLGLGVGLALTGWIWTGLAVIAAGIIASRLIKRSAPRFLLTQMFIDERLYDDVVRAGIMQVTQQEPAA